MGAECLRGIGGSCEGSVGGGEVMSGVGGDTEDPGPAGSVCRSEGATGSKDRNTDVQEETGSRQKKPRMLVEM